MGFMEPQMTNRMDWAECDVDGSTFYIPWEYRGDIPAIGEKSTFGDGLYGILNSVEKVTGYGVRWSAPGYMDCTDYEVFTDEAEAITRYEEMVEEDKEMDGEES